MGKNKEYRKQLDGHRRALEDHLRKISEELEKSDKDEGLIVHWEKTVANCRAQIQKLTRRLES